MRRRRRKTRQLSLDQKLDVVHRALVGREAQMELAREFRVSQAVVSLLVTKVRKRPEFLRELVSERTEKQLLECRLAEFIEAS